MAHKNYDCLFLPTYDGHPRGVPVIEGGGLLVIPGIAVAALITDCFKASSGHTVTVAEEWLASV